MLKSYAECIEPLGTLNINASIIFDDEMKLINDYADKLCNAMSKQFYCVFNLRGHYEGKNIVSFRLNCSVERNKKYVIKYAKGQSEGVFEIYTNNIPACESHQKTPTGRNITATYREELKQQLLSQAPSDVSTLIIALKILIVA